MDPSEFTKILEQIPGIDAEKKAAQFALYYKILIKTNQKYNLTRITEEKEAYLKHFYDSIIPILKFKTSVFHPNMTICDIGTGAGFPGVPLKIIYPDVKLTLLDSSQKKLQFLKELTTKLELTDVDIVWQRAEEFGQDEGREKYDLVVSRAVANLRVLSEYCLPLVRVGGYFLAYKGKNGNQEMIDAKDLIKILGGKIEQELMIDLKQDEDSRSLFLIKKNTITPRKFPRSNSQIKASMKGYHAK